MGRIEQSFQIIAAVRDRRDRTFEITKEGRRILGIRTHYTRILHIPASLAHPSAQLATCRASSAHMLLIAQCDAGGVWMCPDMQVCLAGVELHAPAFQVDSVILYRPTYWIDEPSIEYDASLAKPLVLRLLMVRSPLRRDDGSYGWDDYVPRVGSYFASAAELDAALRLNGVAPLLSSGWARNGDFFYLLDHQPTGIQVQAMACLVCASREQIERGHA